eukprot:CAMPEP_0170565252 /NCGR_PEP_ID=MMETSP0211-20121228/77656_1 /TAXON_ID=311385 /ORGANISM="Pseudokeronopsis sp., Strain OXSARD2" /LENGTH=58 /DNA_ID=CAMNT_0010885793 /DNA_START=223 /DNA_END=399 /DNA_ORIENTATION=-
MKQDNKVNLQKARIEEIKEPGIEMAMHEDDSMSDNSQFSKNASSTFSKPQTGFGSSDT